MTVFEANVLKLWGSQGQRWLANLPNLTAFLARQWGLTQLILVPNLTYNYVLTGLQNSKPIVLKIGFDATALYQESLVLEAFNGNGSIVLLNKNLTENALLLERAEPGITLKSLFPHDDKTAVHTVAAIMQKLHAMSTIPDYNFPTIRDWVAVLDKAHPALSSKHIASARDLAGELIASQDTPTLLHGDLHHENILLSKLGWVAIDPKGVIGERAYEVGAFIRNPFPYLLKQPQAQDIIQTRIHMFSEILSLDKQRLQHWSYVQAVVAACWAMEDGQTNPTLAMAEAEMLYKYI